MAGEDPEAPEVRMRSQVDLKKTIVPSPHAVTSRVGAETVILHLHNGTYYGLDAMGTRVWELLQSGSTIQSVCASLLDQYEVSEHTLTQDIREFIQHLATEALVEEVSDATGSELSSPRQGDQL
jgi:hypothetical protein